MVTNIKNKVKLAKKELGRSVVYVNKSLEDELKDKVGKPLFFGIKDTNQIPKTVIQRVRSNHQFIWLTIDKASNRGRAIDTDLINPITYRVMTGSTSGGPINILKGINDFALGTDGGGSILAPALSCQLPSIIGAGLGVFVKEKKTSTDEIEFRASIGIIGKSVFILRSVMECIINEELEKIERRSLKIIIPKRGILYCPDRIDMHDKVMDKLSKIKELHFSIEEMDMTGIHERQKGIEVIKKAFDEKKADLIVTCEGPVDVYGYGETIPQHFGEIGKSISNHHGKFLVRAANICQATGITVPTESLASGLVIIANKGKGGCVDAIDLAFRLEKIIQMPSVWKRYFMDDNVPLGLDLR